MVDAVTLIAGATALIALVLALAALLRGWHGWLSLRRVQLGAGGEHFASQELRLMRQRVRKLERIALGLD